MRFMLSTVPLRLGLLVVLGLLSTVMLPAAARAELSDSSLLSGTSLLQFDSAEAPALAREGNYVAFEGSLAGVSGIWRRDLQTGAVEAVVTDEPVKGEPGEFTVNAAPSISADGRYIAFTTTADLEPEHTPKGGSLPEGEPAADENCPEVYLRDMDLPSSAPGAYVLVSALNQSGEGIVFSPCGPSSGNTFALAGAQAAPAVALSADGASVAFTVLNASNLTTGVGGALSTPPSQVAVRDIRTKTTTLVTVANASALEGQPVKGGGAFPSEEAERHLSTSGYLGGQFGVEPVGSTAAISGDGSTVAWLGTDVPEQVPGSGPEIEANIKAAGEDPAGDEVEPLLRRIVAGSSAVTKRLLAGAGLDFYFSYTEPFELVHGGSFVDVGGIATFIAPALSEDGEEVAVISNAPRPGTLESLALSHEARPQTDAYLVHVGSTATAQPQATALTETPDYDIPSTSGSHGFVTDIAISPNGERVAFDTERSEFALPRLAAIGLPATSRVSQTYVANLRLDTLQRVAVTYNGSEPSGNAGLLSVGDSRAIVFASAASNLFYGDAMEAPEVYLAEEAPYEPRSAPEEVGSMPNEVPPESEWRMSATAAGNRDGTVLVTVQTPGRGRLAVDADSQLVASTSPAKRSKSAVARRDRSANARFVTRTVAQATASTGASGTLRVSLRAGARYHAKVMAAHGLYSVLHLRFAAAGHPTLTAQIPVTFHRKAKHAAGARRAGNAVRRK